MNMVIKGMDIETCKECKGYMYTYGHRRNTFRLCNTCMITKQQATWKAIQLASNGHSPERGL